MNERSGTGFHFIFRVRALLTVKHGGHQTGQMEAPYITLVSQNAPGATGLDWNLGPDCVKVAYISAAPTAYGRIAKEHTAGQELYRP
jgi:hypothetical protein